MNIYTKIFVLGVILHFRWVLFPYFSKKILDFGVKFGIFGCYSPISPKKFPIWVLNSWVFLGVIHHFLGANPHFRQKFSTLFNKKKYFCLGWYSPFSMGVIHNFLGAKVIDPNKHAYYIHVFQKLYIY